MGKLARHDLSDVANVVVPRADSLRAGNCEPGTDEFIDRFFRDRTSATIAEAVGRTDLASLDESRLTLALLIAACLAPIKRDRQARKIG